MARVRLSPKKVPVLAQNGHFWPKNPLHSWTIGRKFYRHMKLHPFYLPRKIMRFLYECVFAIQVCKIILKSSKDPIFVFDSSCFFFCNFFLVFYFFIFFRGLGCRFGYLRVGNRSGGQAEPFSTSQGSDLPLSNLPVMSCRLSHPLHMVPCILSSNVASIGNSLLDSQGASSN